MFNFYLKNNNTFFKAVYVSELISAMWKFIIKIFFLKKRKKFCIT